MHSVFVQTVIGEDSPNVIDSLAQFTRGQGGEWLMTKISKLAGRFTAMMKVSIPADSEAALKEGLEKEFPELTFVYAPTREAVAGETVTKTLVIDCDDRPGLTRDITRLLADLNLQTENMEFHRFPVTLVGRTVYSAKMTVTMPSDMNAAVIEQELVGLSEGVRVSFE